MLSAPASQLSVMVVEEQSSRVYPWLPTEEHFSVVRQQLKSIVVAFEEFKEDTLSDVHERMGRISTLLYRSLKHRSFLENELEKSKQVQNTMRAEVIQLKEMINSAMNDYAGELRARDAQIELLNQQLRDLPSRGEDSREQIKIEEEQRTERKEELEVIQEESEQATYSSATSLSEFKEDSREEISIVPESHLPSCQLQRTENMFNFEQFSEETQELAQSDHKRTKSFIDNFRKTIEQSFQEKPPAPKQKVAAALPRKEEKESQLEGKGKPGNDNSYAQPLREISNFQEPLQRYYTNFLKDKEPKSSPTPNIPRTLCLHQEAPVSDSNSSSELGQMSQVQRESEVNQVRAFEPPPCLFKKKSPNRQHSKTEASPERYPKPSTNNYFTHKPSNSYAKMDRKPACSRSQSDGKSVRASGSKEKIKVTARMMEEMSYQPKKNHNAPNVKALVHLGGKSLFRKFLLELKTAFKKYSVSVGRADEEFKYEGELRGGQRWGRGRLLFRNGLVYEGEFREGRRHGRGCLSLNGISIYEGEWTCDRLQGEGYIKSMRFMSAGCPSAFHESSYCGNLAEGRLNGMGTIFLNGKEKIVTKFSGGCPVGELTYYNLHEIEFGVWPAE